MKRAAAKNKTTTKNVDDYQKFVDAQVAKSQFFASTFNMGWRLAFMVVVPLVAGVKIDEHFNTAPSFTILGLFIAATAGCLTVWDVVKDVNRQQAEQEKVRSRRKTKRAK